MKALNLTKKQRSRLLKMCKVLFSKFYWKKVYEGDDIKNQAYLTKSCNFYFNVEEEKEEIKIHWFQFCMLHLASKIAFLKEESRLDIIKAIEYYQLNDNTHPVDYLYEQFKELK